MSDHHHHHHHGDGENALLWALLLNGGFLLIEGGVGWWSNSLALLSDAVHMVSDVGALLLAAFALKAAQVPAEERWTFGLKRGEVLGGFINGLTLLLATGYIVWEAAYRLRMGTPEIPGVPVLVVGFIGLVINLGSAAALYRSSHHNLNLRGAFLHMMADALGSVGAIVAALFVINGVPIADPLVSIFMALLILWSTSGLLMATTRVLMQLPPQGLNIRDLKAALGACSGVRSVHDLHLWSLDGQTTIATVHCVVDAPSGPLRAELCNIMRERFHIEHATIQLEASGDAPCALNCGASNTHAH